MTSDQLIAVGIYLLIFAVVALVIWLSERRDRSSTYSKKA